MKTYRENVLDVNKKLKEEEGSLGGIRAQLLSVAKEINLSKYAVGVLRTSKKDKEMYEFLNENVRKTKSGKTTKFYVIQLLHKMEKNK